MKYTVIVYRDVTESVEIEVEASTQNNAEDEARRLAQNKEDYEWSPEDSHYYTAAIFPVEDDSEQ